VFWIFRGDGKTNITEGNCFAKWLNATNTREGYTCAEYLSEDKKDRIPPITKILMNPPFPKKKTDYKEYLFIEQALKQMQNGGILFSVLPYSSMIKGGSYLSWRGRLLKENTLLSVVTFPPELFAPIGVRTVGVFIKKGVPHKDQRVLWVRALCDGFRLKKGMRLRQPNEEDDLDKRAKPLIKDFIENPNMTIESIPEFQKASPINYPPENGVADDNPLCDKELELCPEAYLDEKPVSPKEMNDKIEQLMREAIAVNIKFERELSGSET